MDLRDYLHLLRRRWLWILGSAAVCGALAAGVTSMQTPQYSSTARLFVSTTSSDDTTIYQGGQFAQTRVQSYADLVQGRELAATVIDDLGLDLSPAELADRVKAAVVPNTVNLSITVEDPDPHEAQRITQGYAEAMTDVVRRLETPEGQTVAPVKASVVESASYSDDPVSPQPVRNVGLGVVLGVVLGFGLAILRQLLDTRVGSASDVEDVTDAPTLGAIPYDSSTAKTPLLTQVAPHSPRAESFRVLRTNLQFVDVDSTYKAFVVTSAVPDEGKTTSSLNLAISLAQGGARTILVEADLRRPKAATRLGIDGSVGVTTVLVGRVKLADAIQADEESGLDFLAAGAIPPNPAELLQSNAMAELLGELRSSYDYVIIDAPPLLPVTDAALLSAKADGALLVLSHGKVTRDQVAGAVERLKQVDAHLVGLVMNKIPAKGKGYSYGNRYGYGYGYGYGYAPEAQKGRRRRASRRSRQAPQASRASSPGSSPMEVDE